MKRLIFFIYGFDPTTDEAKRALVKSALNIISETEKYLLSKMYIAKVEICFVPSCIVSASAKNSITVELRYQDNVQAVMLRDPSIQILFEKHLTKRGTKNDYSFVTSSINIV
jgi:hypothetical protein